MTLPQRVDADLKEAMRAKAALKLSVLRMLKAALKNAAIEKSDADAEMSDAEAVQVIRKQAKQRQDSIESFEKVDVPSWPRKKKRNCRSCNRICRSK